MKRDDWQRAMEHEAATVPDPKWAEETRWSALRYRWSDLPGPALCFALLAAAQVILFAADPPEQLWLGVMLAVGALSCGLGVRGHHPFVVGAASLIYFPAAWLTVALMQWLGSGVTSPGVDDMGWIVLAVLAMNATGLWPSWQTLSTLFCKRKENT
ncbi:hypothetical protein SAMN04488058_10228 [Deinococcus reticulitermitis]|uniref:Uncharacterized protein n=1 Tax=Deinococcus reticulitermitis TaxID=856736 RepID=A0A1H6U9C6_9DEIO|nr:hypothetical protein [Deinococcus reticulitermitis]SEI84462.1 hypothetical protein SAMN04488058_10228 [Deinococcus reticulitermitis]